MTEQFELMQKEVDRQGKQIDDLVHIELAEKEWRDHTSGKIDEMHRLLVTENGGRGSVLTRLGILEKTVDSLKEFFGLKVDHAREVSIDWKTVGTLLFGVLQAILLIYIASRQGG